MSKNVEFEDNRVLIYSKIGGCVQDALAAMGQVAVNEIVKQMEHGYYKNIRQTGNLQRDVRYAVENSGPNTVDVGNTLGYSIFVHDGTVKMQARHYIRDTLTNPAVQALIQTAAETEFAEVFEADWLAE